MARANSKKANDPAVGRRLGLGATQSLQFKLGALFLLALLLLAAGAFLASRTLVQEKLLDQSFRYEQEAGLRLTADLRGLIGDAQALAGALANLAADSDLNLGELRSVGPTLLKNRPSAQLVASLGIWPEPNKLPGAGERSSHYWMRDSSGALRARSDYNDARSAPYYQERWYTPARYLKAGRGMWTDRRMEPLLSRYVLTYAVPILLNGEFAGVATVSLDAAALNERFAALAGAEGYALLLDGGQRLIGLSGTARSKLGVQAPLGTTLATLAKSVPAYSPIAIAAFKRSEAQQLAMMQSKLYDAKQVSALKDGTRELSRQEADDLLTGIWSADLPKPILTGNDRDALEADPVLGKASWASVFDLQNPAWTLLRMTPADEGFSGASYLFRQSLVVTLGLVTLTLALAFVALRAMVIRPLRQMIDQLAGSHTIEDALSIVLDASARNEVGMVAHWQNERIRQLREAMDMSRAAKSQLSSESSERKQAQEQLARAQERAALALQSVSDAVVTTDEHGHIEDMNLAAETMTGLTLRESRGRPLTEIVRLRVEDQEGYQNLALLAMERGARLDYTGTVALEPITGGTRELVLNGSPLRSRGRMVGAVLAFHEHARREARGDSGEAFATANRHQQDLLTALATRAPCERRITQLIEQARASGLTHGLIYLDLDHLKRINDLGGQAAGDDVLVRVAETLAQAVPAAKDVYRIAADQFVIVAESVTAEAIHALAEQIRAQLAGTRFYWESQYFSVTGSLGVVLLDAQTSTATEAIRHADDACAAAKRAGRNNVQLYDERMDRVGRMVDDDTWVRCIRRGLSENLFHLRTQWIMAGKDYAAEGQCYEVLLALEDEEGFWASPAAFMPVAERHHLTTAIDRWVIEHTLRYLEEHPVTVESMAFCSINLSTATLAEPAFLDFITEQIARYPNIAPKLCFELREPSLTDHPREAMLCCDVLHRLGCRLSIDHYFGRNLSDLTMLRKLPVEFVKLDAQGFKSLGGDAVEHMLAESILRIVRHLRRRVIVNNIDDASMMETWKKLGADYFQGYAFAKPTPVPFLAPN